MESLLGVVWLGEASILQGLSEPCQKPRIERGEKGQVSF